MDIKQPVKNVMHASNDLEDYPTTSQQQFEISDQSFSKPQIRTYRGYDRSVWIGFYVGTLTFIVCNNIFTFLLFGFVTYPALGIVVWIIDLFILLPAFLEARKGLAATEPSVPELKGSWNVSQLVLLSFLLFQGVLWGMQSLFKQAADMSPKCIEQEGQSQDAYDQACSWADNKGYFYLHAISGPLVLMCSVFNFMRFSRGLVFPIEYHIWVGRIHNILLLVATIGAGLLADVSATADWIKIGFYILLCLWAPTMLMGWYHIRWNNKNIPMHKRWMTRNFALTVCAITLRLYNVLSLGNTPYYLMVYLSLIHPCIVEYYLQQEDDCDKQWWYAIWCSLTGTSAQPSSKLCFS